ncbi:MAG: cobalamin B12-binding domain-containing protein [Deltaproteobacteria bacterium]|nr:cobalamin B12-binding domain-containing protein [Deltaproteobacteria bacterium]
MTSRPRLLLLTPPYHSGVVESAGVWLPLNLVYLAGHARAAGAEVRVYDAMSYFHSHEDIAREIESFRPDIVALGPITAMEPDARIVCAAAKRWNPSTITVLGNVHSTFCWDQLLREDPNVDLVVRGEGEQTIGDIVRAVAAGGGETEWAKIDGVSYRRGGVPVSNRPRRFTQDLDSLTPAWDLVDWKIYWYRPSPAGRLAITSSARGCGQRCSFCSQQKFWERTWRGRDPLKFVQELEHLRDTYNVRVAMLSDETPTSSRQRWERILDLLVERQTGVEILMETRVDDILRDEAILPKYKAAGVSHIYVGVEATNQSTLNLYNKDIKVAESKRAIDLINAHDIVSETSFVLGTPEETVESIRKTVELAKWYGPDMAFFLAITPWPYSDIALDASSGLASRVATTDYRKYNLVEPVVKPDGMTLAEMQRELHMATGHFFYDKFKNLEKLSPWKRSFMIRVLKLLIQESYLGKEMHKMASGAHMPEAVKRMLAEMETEGRAVEAERARTNG